MKTLAKTTAVEQLNRVKYAGQDFPTHFDDLRSQLQAKFAKDFNDFTLSSLAIMLMDLTAYGLDALSFYLDRRASDAYLETARTRKAVARLTRQLGYKMGGAVSASTDLRVRLTQPPPFSVTIPRGFQFRGPDNLIFEASEAVTFPPLSSAPLLVPVYEGETITETFVGDGTPSQVYELLAVPPGKHVVQGTVKVLVNGTPYTEAEFLPVTGGQFFEVGYNDDPATVRFGDGTVSQSDIPSANSTITVSYIAARGLKGQVAANTITAVVSPLVVSFTTIPLEVTNPEAAVGGDDPESLERAKRLAPEVYKSRRVAVTQSDYVALSSAYADPLFGRVAVAQAYSTRSAATDVALQFLLQAVTNVTAPIYSGVAAQLASLGIISGNISGALTSLGATLSAIGTESSGANSSATSAQTTLQGVTNATDLALSRCAAGTTTVGSIPLASGLNVQTTASYTQPLSIGADVTVQVNSIANCRIGQAVTVSLSGTPVGTYTVKTVPTTTSVLLTLTAVGSVTFGGTVATNATVSSVAEDRLTVNTRTEILAQFSGLTTDISTMLGGITTALSAVEDVEDRMATIGLSPASGLLLQADTLRTSASTSNAAIPSVSSAINALVLPLDANGSGTGTITTSLSAIHEHVDRILSANCSSNLVTVPILTLDSSGFYVGPSLGLRISLQSYLEARKAVTQTVEVVSGVDLLVYAVLRVQVAVRSGYSEAVVRLAATAALDTLLKGRKFGVSLYRSDIVDAVLAVDGVAYVNPVIEGHYTAQNPTVVAGKLDSFGNLVVSENEVVTKGTVDVTTVSFN